MGTPRPFKLWTGDRSIKKSLVAATLDELINKGLQRELILPSLLGCNIAGSNIGQSILYEGTAKLGMSEDDVTVVLEEDGTIVEEEDFFSFLKANTILLLLKPGESWTAIWDQRGGDETDAMADAEVGGLSELASRLRNNVGCLLLMSPEELEVIADASDKELSELTGYDVMDARRLRLQCQRYADERQDARDALALLSLLQRVHSGPPAVNYRLPASPDMSSAESGYHSHPTT